MRTAVVTGLTIVMAVLTNYATQFGPAWTRNPWIVWPAAALFAVLTIVAAVAANRLRTPDPAGRSRLDSLRAPALDVLVRGRENELDRLAAMVRNPRGRFAVICGAGGSGKTTLAAELATRVQVPVWWVRFADADSFAAQLRQIAESLGLTIRHGQSLPDAVWSALSTGKRWLLVIDNLDHPQSLSPTGEPLAEHRGWVRAGGRGLLLVTSRDAEPAGWGPGAELFNVDSLSVRDAATVLLDTAPQAGDRTQAKALAARLGGFPLALRVTGRMLAQPTARYRTFETYRKALDSELGDILATPHPGALTIDQKRTLLRYTWDLSLDQLADTGFPAARPLLRVLSLAADAPLPRDLITPDLLKGKATPAAVDGALAGLNRYGLVSMHSATLDCVTLHSLIREITAMVLADEADTRSWQTNLDRILLLDARQAATAGRAGFDRVALLVPHLAPIPDHLDGSHKAIRSVCRKLIAVAESLEGTGTAHSRAILWARIHSALLAIKGPDRQLLGSLSKLATALNDLCDFHRAADLHRQAAIGFEHLLGADDANTLASRSNFAAALHNLNELTRSADLQAQIVADCIRVLDTDHPHTMISSDHLAHVRRDLRQRTTHIAPAPASRVPQPAFCCHDTKYAIHVLSALQTVRSSCEEILAHCRRELGRDHPATMLCVNLHTEIRGNMDLVRKVILEATTQNQTSPEHVLETSHRNAIRARDNLAGIQTRLSTRSRARSWRTLANRHHR
ncbi:MAG: tetratricopeptide repeat protein [Kibdelosporangium sp.]